LRVEEVDMDISRAIRRCPMITGWAKAGIYDGLQRYVTGSL